MLAETTDPVEIASQYEESFATDPWYIHLYRTGHAYHGVHPFYMWYWCAHALEHLGAVIIVGGDPAAVRRLGLHARLAPWPTPSRWPSDVVGRDPVDHPPAHPAAPHGRRAVTRGRQLRAATGPSTRAGRAGRFPLGRARDWPDRPVDRGPTARAHSSALDYDTDWSRRYPARLARAVVLDNVTRPLAHVVASPRSAGDEILELLEAPVIFVANHASHLDTALLLSILPAPVPPPDGGGRRPPTTSSTGAGRRTLWSFALGAIPIERHRVNRQSADTAAELLDDGWNLIIFPEGGRSPDGWFQEFTRRRRLPGPPHGPPGGARPHRRHLPDPAQGRQAACAGSPTRITFGTPLSPAEGENARRFEARIEAARGHPGRRGRHRLVDGPPAGRGGDDARRAGPDAAPWRRAWALGPTGRRRADDGRRR